MTHTIPELTFWESTDPVFILDFGRAQKTLREDEATRLFHALGAFLQEPTATLGVDEYTVLGQWHNLKEKGRVKGSMDVAQARGALYAALYSHLIDTTQEIDRIGAYLMDLAHGHQGTPS